MSAPSSSTYAETYGGVIFWPRNGTFTMQYVVTVPLSGSSTSSVVGHAVDRAGAARRDVDLVAGRAALAEDPPLGEAAEELRLLGGGGVVVGEADRADDPGDRVLPSGRATSRLPDVVSSRLDRRAALDRAVVTGSKQAMSVIAPTVSSAQRTFTRMPGLHVGGRGHVDGVQQRGVGAVELDSANANGWSRGWSITGSATHDHVCTTPSSPTATISVTGAG